MNERSRILTQILADTDAIWLPNRTWEGCRSSNVYCARRDFHRTGVVWESHASLEADRKAIQRTLEVLASEKFVHVRRPHRVKTLTVRLSDAADAQARKVVGLPGLRSAWWTCRKVAENSKRSPKLLTDLWVGEAALIGNVRAGQNWGQEAVLVEDMALPVLVRGYLMSNADAAGHVSYALTPAGWEWIGTPEPAEDLTGRVDDEARDFYHERLQVSGARLDSTESEPREIGYLPLPVSMAGLPVSVPPKPREVRR